MNPRNILGILISNVAFPKYLEEEISVKGKDCGLILQYTLNSIKQLEDAGADFIVLPCNTLHSLAPEIRSYSKLPLIDLIEEASNEVKSRYKKIGILCTNKTRKEALYDKLLNGVEIIYPNELEQQKVSKIIIRIIKSKKLEKDKIYLNELIINFVDAGAEKVLLACTDLANLVENEKTLDTTDILIRAIKKEMKK